MAEVRNGNMHGSSDVAHAKKRKGFWSSIFSRSSSNATKNKNDAPPEQPGFMDSLAINARQAAAKEVVHVVDHEARKQIDAELNNNGNASQTTNTWANGAPDASTVTTPSDALSASTNWVKRMVNGAQQKVQGLQNLPS